MIVKLFYKASDKLQGDRIVQTGERLPNYPFVAVELSELTPEQRAILVRSGIQHTARDGDKIELPCPVQRIDTDYPGPRFRTADAHRFDAVPTVEEWLAMAAAALASQDQWRPQLDALIAEKQAAEKAHKQRVAELEAEYKALQAEWFPRIDAMAEDEAKQPLPEHIRQIESEMDKLKAGIFGRGRISREMSDHWQSLRDTRIKADAAAAKAAWVEAHGSDHLKRACNGGYDCQRMYVRERAAIEAPGYTVDFEDAARWKDRSCPSLQALDEADVAMKLGIGSVEIVWLTEPARDRKPRYDEYDPGYDNFEPCEAVVISSYLGKYDLVAIL